MGIPIILGLGSSSVTAIELIHIILWLIFILVLERCSVQNSPSGVFWQPVV